jgi:hypothetical protein
MRNKQDSVLHFDHPSRAAVILMLLRIVWTQTMDDLESLRKVGARRGLTMLWELPGEARSESTADLHRSKSDTRSPTTNISAWESCPTTRLRDTWTSIRSFFAVDHYRGRLRVESEDWPKGHGRCLPQ